MLNYGFRVMIGLASVVRLSEGKDKIVYIKELGVSFIMPRWALSIVGIT
jgi:hypothetical protein